MSRDPRDVIIQPVVSEKTYAEAERGKYTFIVHAKSTKPEIRSAVQHIWGVRVLKVNTLKRRGKSVRRYMQFGQRPDRKRAVVTLAAGEKIDLFEGA